MLVRGLHAIALGSLFGFALPLASCSFADLELSDLSCPCGTGHVCVNSRCVRGDIDAGPQSDPDARSDALDAALLDTGDVQNAQDVPSIRDAGGVDTTVPDAADSGPDAGALCSRAPEPGTVFQFQLDSTSFPVTDSVGGFVASVISPAPALSSGPCGSAVLWSGAGALEVPSSASFDLLSGSYDFWVYASAGDHPSMGLVSRDAMGEASPGHSSVYWSVDNRVVARLQDSETDPTVIRCSDTPLPQEEWVHVGVNFGPPDFELWVNGANVTGSGPVQTPGSTGTTMCTPDLRQTTGIAGNENPWVFGAYSGRSVEGMATPLSGPLRGRLARVRLSAVRRDFSIYAP